jgi:hypothetical protein
MHDARDEGEATKKKWSTNPAHHPLSADLEDKNISAQPLKSQLLLFPLRKIK